MSIFNIYTFISQAYVDENQRLVPLKTHGKENNFFISSLIDENWSSYVNPAVNIHECNVLMMQDGKLEVVRKIEKGQELLVWLNESLMRAMNFPYLLPHNFLSKSDAFMFYE